MKKFLIGLILFFNLGLFFNAHASINGEGNLQLTYNQVEYFMKYIKGKKGNPTVFLVAEDGSYAIYWSCPKGQECSTGNVKSWVKDCTNRANVECKVFARKRHIKWKNDINPGKGKISKISSKLTMDELLLKLTELGFYANSTTAKTSTKKVVKKITTKGDLDGFMNALEKAKNAGLTIDADTTAKQFGYNNFEEFFAHYKSKFEIGDVTVDEAKEMLLGTDNTINIVESQENLDKLHKLIINDKYFRKRTSYFKKKHKDKLKLLVVYMNYEKEMSKITKDPNLDKIGRFDFRFRWGPSIEDMKGFAYLDCEASRKKYKLSGGECIIVESRIGDDFTNLLKPRLKSKKIKKTEKKIEIAEKQKKIEINQTELDNEPPIIVISEFITVKDPNFEISGKVTDKGTNVIYVKADDQDIPIENGSFKIKKYSPIDTEIKITAIDEWGNKSSKLIKIKIEKEATDVAEKLEPLNPSIMNVQVNDNKVALIIGIENYADIVKASYAKADAQYFGEYSSKALGIKSNNIKVLVDEEATFIKINKILKKWLKSKIIKGKTELVIFYAGHGLASKDGKELYLLPQDGDADLLSISSISRTALFNEIKDLKPKSVTIFLDACYTGSSRDNEILLADARPVKIVADEEQDVPNNFTIFSASKNSQISSGLKKAKHGIFSYFLMKGLEGNADTNKDNKITNGELLSYLDLNVSQKAAELGREQNPSLSGDPNKVLISY